MLLSGFLFLLALKLLGYCNSAWDCQICIKTPIFVFLACFTLASYTLKDGGGSLYGKYREQQTWF